MLLCFEIFAARANNLQSEDNRNRIFFPPRRKDTKVMEKSDKRLQIIFTLNSPTSRSLRLCWGYSKIWLRLRRAGSFVVSSYFPRQLRIAARRRHCDTIHV